MVKRAILASILAAAAASVASAQGDAPVVHGPRYWSALAAGAATSILIH